MKEIMEYVTPILIFFVLLVLFKYLWPVLLILLVVVLALVFYWNYKVKKAIKEAEKETQRLEQDSTYSQWYQAPQDDSIEEPVRNATVIDATYVEHDESDE